jgi:phospholipase D1/2
MSTDPANGFLQPGRNCTSIEHADRVSFIVDGADYFAAFRAAACRARHSIVIVGWDIDSRIRLVPDGADDGLPESLGDFLRALVDRRRDLHIYVLDWDFAMLVAAGRELRPVYSMGWRRHRGLQFHLDSAHPIGACHHQKIVVIDDALAFVGGFDLTHCRWDTIAHSPSDPRRRHPNGEACPPFHDVQMAVAGPIAVALGGLVRERWQRATGKRLRSSAAGAIDEVWPPELGIDLADVAVAVARTQPAYQDWPEVQEIKQLYLDAIRATRRHLYVENQYFSAGEIASAIADRIRAPDGPQLALVSRRRDTGWLEESTMGVMRARLHRRLREADPGGRFGAFYPFVPELGDGFVNVHSKLLIADDDFMTIGSANLNNRSMGYDTECNLAIHGAGDDRVCVAIRDIRQRLLAEHLGTTPAEVGRAERERGNLLEAIASLRSDGRTLELLEPQVSEALDTMMPSGDVLDPERPVALDELVSELVPPEAAVSVAGRLVAVGVLLVAFVALAAAWRWTPLGAWLDFDGLARMARALQNHSWAPVMVLLAYVVAGFLVVPVTLLIIATVLVFGSWLGPVYALSGSLLSAATIYGLGRVLGRDAVRALAGPRLNRLSRRLGESGVLAIAALRLLPLAPFSIVNLVAGATHIGTRDFLLGTLLGMAPGAIAMAVFIDRVSAAVQDPSGGTFGIAAIVAGLLLTAVVVLRRWVARRDAAGRTR